MISFGNKRRLRPNLRCLLPILLLFILTGCGGSEAPTPAPLFGEDRPTPTPLPTAPAWRVASQPVTVENVPEISMLGRLEAPGTATTVFAWALSPDNTRLVGLNNGLTVAWDLVTGKLVFSTSRQDATRVFYSPDKDQIFATAVDGSIYVLNSEDGTYEAALDGIDNYNDVTAYAPDDGVLAMASTTGDINIWNLPEQTELVTLPGSGSQPVAMVFSPDYSRLAVAYNAGVVLIWDWQTHNVAANPVFPTNQSGLVDQLRFSPDGQMLVGMAGDTGLVWKADDGKLVSTLAIENGGSTYLFKISPDSQYVIAGGIASDTTLWNIQTGKLAAALPNVGGNNVDAVFSPDSQLLFTSLLSGSVALWNLSNLANGTIARGVQPIANTNILNLIWTEDGYLVLLIDARGPIEVWGIP